MNQLTPAIHAIPQLNRKLAAIWLLIAVHDYALYVVFLDRGQLPHSRLLPFVLARAMLWFGVSRLLFFVTDAVAPRGRLFGSVVLTATLLAMTFLTLGFNAVFLSRILWRGVPLSSVLLNLLVFDFHACWLWIAMIMAMGLGIRIWQQREQSALRKIQLETELTRAMLGALSHQLEPHFIFNTLTGAAALCLRDVPAARSMIGGLQQLLGYSLGSREPDTVPLRAELEFIFAYLRLQQMRFGDRLIVRQGDVTEAALECSVPRLVLQPLVENAIKYGVGRANESVTIDVSARVVGRELLIAIRNSEHGPVAEAGAGIGLAGVRARLSLVFPEAHAIRLRRDPRTSSVAVEVWMPAIPSRRSTSTP